ncbi:MAG: alpha/beta hydrolase [Chloroflexi bacterium]|nr:alpha/beta hydrolase [Chloroflexota bacterium]
MSKQIQPQDKQIEFDGLQLHYLDWGNADAQPMVLLHGLQDCARSWDFFADSFCSDYHVIALDHRGHGDSGHASSDRYRLQDYVADIEALVEQLGFQRIVLVGHSAGGRNAFVYAAKHAEMVESMVIVDIDPDAANPDSQGMFKRYMSESDDWDSLEAVVERLRSRAPNSTDEMLAHQARHMTKDLPDGRRAWKRDRTLLAAYERPDLWAEWSQISQPTLIIRGRQSNLLTHEVAVKMSEAIPRTRLAELEGGGHWFYQEIPDEFETTVRWFLENLP